MLQITKDTTNVSVVIRVVDSTDGTPETSVSHDTTGIDLWYRRESAAKTSITEAALAALTTAHTDGGVEPIADGWVRLDLPDAACATGVAGVQIGGTITGMIVHAPYIQLTDVDLFDAIRGGMAALPNAAADAAGGLPISDLGGLDLDARIQIDIAAILVDTGTTLDDHLTDIKGTSFVKDTHSLIDIETFVDILDDGTSGNAKIATDVALVLVDTGTTLDTKINDLQGSGFVESTDSNEAIRNRGDSAWTGGPTTSDTGTAQAGSSTTMTLEAGFITVDETYTGQVISITAGTGIGQSRAIGSYVGSTGVATIIGTWATNPDATSVYDIYPDDIDEITAAPTVDLVADAVWDENTTGHAIAGTFGEQLKNDVDAILDDTNTLETSWVDGGRLDLIIDAILDDTAVIGALGAGLTNIPWNSGWDVEVESEVNDAMVVLNLDHLMAVAVTGADVVDDTVIAFLVDDAATADWDNYDNTTASLEALNVDMDAIKAETALIVADTNELQTDWTNAGRLDALLDLIKAKTDDLTFTVALQLDANVQSINDAAVTGDGAGTPWDG